MYHNIHTNLILLKNSQSIIRSRLLPFKEEFRYIVQYFMRIVKTLIFIILIKYCTIYSKLNRIYFCSFFFFFFGCVGSSFLCEGFLQLRRAGATLHRGARTSHYRGLSCCGALAPDAQAQQLWLTGLVAPRHVGSSQTRAQTRVPLQWQADSQPPRHQGSRFCSFLIHILMGCVITIKQVLKCFCQVMETCNYFKQLDSAFEFRETKYMVNSYHC